MADEDGTGGDVLEKKLEKSERAAAIARASQSEAERRAAASAAEAQRYRTQAEQGQSANVTAQVAALEADRDKLKREYAQHLADGEFEKASDVQFQMSEVAAKLTQWQGAKAHLEAAKDGKGKEEKPAAGTPEEQREAFINSRSAATGAWLREHPDYFTDPKLQARVTGAHNMAIGNDIKVDSQEYFEFIEKQAGLTQDDDGGEVVESEVKQPVSKMPKAGQKRVPVSPAPSREATGAPVKLKAGEIHLNEAMMNGARLAGIEATDKAGLESYHNDYVKRFRAGEISDWAGIMTRK